MLFVFLLTCPCSSTFTRDHYLESAVVCSGLLRTRMMDLLTIVSINAMFCCKGLSEAGQLYLELLGFWTLSIVRYSVSVLR
jgi:hypothetical protein